NGDGYSDIVIGAYSFDKGQVDEGAAFVWMGMADGVNADIKTKLEIDHSGAQFGWSVANAGDVNGDGFGDIAISANAYDNGQAYEGAVFIYHGSLNGIGNVANTIIECNQSFSSMGSVAGAGDVNGDGFGDLLVGVGLYGEKETGAVFIFHGSFAGISNVPNTTILGKQEEDANFGSAVAGAGDINGDGFSDIIIGSPGLDVTFPYADQGAAFIYYGSKAGINTMVPNVTLVEGGDWFNYGSEVCGAGDINADGYSDVIVGSPFYSNGEDYEGAGYIYFGSPNGLDKASKKIVESNKAEARMGTSIGSSDVNGDGYPDLYFGAPYYTNGEYLEGAVFIYYGLNGWVQTQPMIIESNKANAGMGSVANAGDTNGDGYSEVIVGAVGFSNGQSNEGVAFVFNGSGNGLIKTPSFSFEGNQESAFMGNAIGGAGDINGDGYSDIITTAHQYDNGQLNEGMSFIFYGNKTGGLQNNLRLYNSDLTTPINQSQKAKNNFGVGFFAKSFLGRNKGKLVWETKAKGQGFSKGANNVITNSTMSTGSWIGYASLGLTGVEMKSVIAKQGTSTKVRVRVKYDPALALTG
ncbi:FG-GAP-like repeat-containing protein, partial [Dyadobacter alkalitolerans]|uniref:FG-GAP-like repeat-containing protein n=1 Tax=Dyadobacter alkalitolerans TaxID=492736 RepID=UPI000551670F